MTVLDMESDRVAAEPPEVAQRRRPWRALFRAMRPHHWVKNLLVFAPLVFSHSVSDPRLLLLSVLAFVVFCAAASVIYLLNDAADVESDRRHPEKRFRPIAAGELRTSEAMWGAGGLLVFSAGVSLATLPWMFSLSVLVYLVVNAAYTFWLKRKVMIDIVVLAGMYTLRMIAGAAATGIMLSEWLLALSTFLFLSLAFLKRHSELRRLRDEGTTRTDNRGYQVVDIELIQTMGSTCGLLAVLVLALYINSASQGDVFAAKLVVVDLPVVAVRGGQNLDLGPSRRHPRGSTCFYTQGQDELDRSGTGNSGRRGISLAGPSSA